MKKCAIRNRNIDTWELRKECKKLMIDVGLDKLGAQKILAAKLEANRNSLCMALTGYRTGKSAERLLLALRDCLLAMKNAARKPTSRLVHRTSCLEKQKCRGS